MMVIDQSIIETVSAGALKSPADLMEDLRASTGEHVLGLQKEVRNHCRPYHNVSRHVVDEHTDRHKRTGARIGLIEGYLIANRQIAIESANT